MAKKRKLTPKRERFCQEYLIDLNASAAARRAGFSEKTAYSMGQFLLKDIEVKQRIHELQVNSATEFNITKQRVMQVLHNIIGSDVNDLIDKETGAVLPPSQWPEHMKGVVSGIETDELYASGMPIGLKRKVKLWDKNKAIELLNKMLGFNMPDKVAQTDSTGTQDIIPVIKVYPVMPKNDDDD